MVADYDAGTRGEVFCAGDDLEADTGCEAHGVHKGAGGEMLREAVVTG